ncbi:MAG: UDP-N-acetylmuramoyl-tripeptide--D-alanyl-D-alanine ligase [Gemmatimonadota bacterium]
MSTFHWTDARVREALGLRLDRVRGEVEFAGVSTDSRTLEEGELYVALVGDRFDGHGFVAEAFARGAGAAVVSRPVEGESTQLYLVDDTLGALGALASYRRKKLAVPVVGITGSVGKTSTKDLTRGALSGALRVHATEGNRNNRVGLPLTLLETPESAEAVVLELGTNEPGEIATLAAVARPDVGVVTTVGESHLEKLGSVRGVLEEKLELLRGLAAGGQCVVGDEPELLAKEARKVCPEVRVAGWSERADEALRPGDVEVDTWGVHRVRWRGHMVKLRLPGRHAVTNALLALAVAELLGVDAGVAVKGLAEVEGGPLRGEIRQVGGLTLIVDCYNANPPSVRAALDVLEGYGGARRVAVLGTMLELGSASRSLHRDVLRDALSRDVDLVVATGEFARVDVPGDVGRDRLLSADDWAGAYPSLRERLGGDEVVLLKASRGVAMEGILGRLDADFGSPAEADTEEVS